jgi:RNA polymerase sigma factor (sigma-70 family)
MTVLEKVVRRLRGVMPGEETDAALLGRFIRERDEASFALLVRRHGPMVLGVCRRVLRNLHDAEDAFQATFVVLVRRAGSVRSPASLAHWLYGVAYRTALEAKRAAARRRAKEAAVTPRTEASDGPDLGILDEEISRLPDKLRDALVLCDLQGSSRKQAARQLGCAEGTVASRLSRGRELLGRRLSRRGFTLSWPLGAAVPVPAALVSGTVRAAGGSAASVVLALVERMLKVMLLSRLKPILVLLLGLLVTGVTVMRAASDDVGAGNKPPPQQSRPVQGVSDAEFIRKACLDIRGSLPTDIEVHYFLQDKSLTKRTWLVEKLKEEARARKATRVEEARPLEGTWQAVALELRGQPGPKEVVKGMKVVFTGDQMSTYRTGKLIGTNAFWLQPGKRPAVMLLKAAKGQGEGRTFQAIYELKGDRLRVCLNLDPDGPPPAEFRTGSGPGGSGAELIELRRVTRPE